MSTIPPTLHVCTACRAGHDLAEGETPAGQALHDALLPLAGDALVLRPVTCLCGCERGCTAVISQPGKWSYMLGNLDAGQAADLVTYAAAYAASGSGTVLPSRRPASLQRAIIGRVPATESAA